VKKCETDISGPYNDLGQELCSKKATHFVFRPNFKEANLYVCLTHRKLYVHDKKWAIISLKKRK
jgi:hypothetical protein